MSIPKQIKGALLQRARLLRREARRMQVKARGGISALEGAPVLFANSFPKSGTHLLTQVLQGFTHLGAALDSGLPAVVMYDGFNGAARTLDVILKDLQRFKAGDIGYGHLHSAAQIVEYLCAAGVAPYFILRDPRDVVVSHVHYITDMEPNHIHHRYYTEELRSFDERLRVSIVGLAQWGDDFPNVAARFAPYLGWMEREEVFVLRYEDFITARQETLRRVIQHAVRRGFRLTIADDPQFSHSVRVLESAINPQRSPTFRKGKVNAWKDEFSTENKRIFKEVAGDLLIRLGYEKDYDW